MEWTKLIIDKLVALLNVTLWPVVAIVALWLLREPLKRFFEYLRQLMETREVEITRSGFKVGAAVDASAQKKVEQPQVPARAPHHDRPDIAPWMDELTKEVETQLSQGDLLPDADRETRLKWAVVDLRAILEVERIYHRIFGSQQRFLKFLGGLEKDQPAVFPGVVKAGFYDPEITNWPSVYPSYPFEDWINFLKNNGLINEDAGQNITLTDKGRAFLAHTATMPERWA